MLPGKWLLAGDGAGDDVREELTLQKLWEQGRDSGSEPVFPEGLGSPPNLACGVSCLCFFHLEKSRGGSC